MANLETLELTISANAESATQGIESLTRSLSDLAKSVGKSVRGLIRLNSELKTLKGFGAIKMPGASTKTAAKAIKKGAASEYDVANNNGRGYKVTSPTAESLKKDKEWMEKFRENATADYKSKQEYHAKATEWRKKQAEAIKQEQTAKEEYAKISRKASEEAFKAERAAMETRGEDTKAIIEQSTQVQLLKLKYEALKMETVSLAKENKLTTKQIASRGIELQRLEEQIKKLESSEENMKSKAAQVGNVARESFKKIGESAKETASSLGKLVSQIGRIFKTMLIRQAIRFILKAAKEGFENYYNYSKQIGGEFAKSFDSLKSKWTQFKNQFGVVLGSALKSVIPLLNLIADAAIYALNAVSALFALLSGKTTYTKAKEGMDEVTESTKKATGAAKEWIAAFDELNVMSKSSGGGVSGDTGIDYGEMFEEVALPDWMLEWKPIIEAVVYGTLGAIILPKIFDWVSKIFGIFTGKTALKALDDMVDLFDPDKKFPDLGNAATDMVALGGGAVAAAAALPTVSTEIEKIVTALNGVSLVSGFIGLLTELITKAVSAIRVPITLDSKNYDEWVAKHEEWIKKVDKKNVRITYDNDIPVVTRLTNWLATEDEKKIKITIDSDPATIVKITNWANDVSVKKIKVEIDSDPATVVRLQNWTSKEDVKKIKVQIDDDPAKVIKINNWVLANDVKKIGVEIPDISAQTTEMSLFAIAATTANIAMDGIADSITKISLISGAISIIKQLLDTIISMGASAFADKTVNVKIEPDENYTSVKEWAAKEETKTINIDFVYDETKMALVESIVNADANKTITIKIELINLNGVPNKTISDLLGWIVGADDDSYLKPDSSIQIDKTKVGQKVTSKGNGKTPNNMFDFLDWDITQWWNYITTGKPGKSSWPTRELFDQMMEGFDIEAWIDSNFKPQEPVKEDVSEYLQIEGWSDLHKTIQKYAVKSMTLDSQTIKSLKQANVPASYVVKMVNWEELTLEQKYNFINSIKESFGSSEAIAAAKSAGIDIGNMVEEGMNSQDADIRKQAEEWNTIINNGVEKKQPVVKPELDKYTVTNISSTLKSQIESNTNPIIKATATPKKGAVQTLEDIFEQSAQPIITARAAVPAKTLLQVYHSIADMTPDITVGIQKTSNFNAVLSEISSGVLHAFEQVFKATVNGSLVGTLSILPALATGGLVTSGDVFVANENGNSELIGRFGNQTGVANQMEIISGIEKGVADANQEQNELLRVQNNLLRGILEKDTSVRIGASAALGRVTRQSLDMYSAVMG